MSNVTYDMDTSGGLMPLIRALIKPPDEEPPVPKPKKSQHPYYKRPGKGHNHDSCDACGEGGDLICCDRCPASFHLGCYDPPLEENDIPAGLWLCRECRASDAEKPSSARGSRAPSPVDSKSDTEKKTRTLRSRESSKKRGNSTDSEKEKEKKEPPPRKEPTPMELLVNAARAMNPRQFELPREMRIPCDFPGTEKEGSKTGNATVVTVDNMGLVPLPAKSCFVCSKTCKHAPLIQCDYCALLFHQDCLDPPLTALPTGRWMCPNHVENFIDWKLVNSISATERVALWDKFRAPIDQHAVKIDFIRQARRFKPRFRQKIPISVKGRVQVPNMVRSHYARPAPLIPSRREHVRCRNVLKNQEQIGILTESDDEDKPKHKVCLNIDCTTDHNAPPPTKQPKKLAKDDNDDGKKAGDDGDAKSDDKHAKGDDKHVKSEDKHAKSDDKHVKSEVKHAKSDDKHAKSDDKHVKSEDKDAKSEDNNAKSEIKKDMNTVLGTLDDRPSSSLSDSDLEHLTAPVARPARPARAPVAPVALAPEADYIMDLVDLELRHFDQRLIKLLAYQRLRQILAGEVNCGSLRDAPLSESAARFVTKCLPASASVAQPLPSELLSEADRARISCAVWGGGAQPQACAPPASPPPAMSLSDACVRATLVPTRCGPNGSTVLGRPIPMRGAALHIGTGGACQVQLDPARCRRVSPNHAVIFMDEVSRYFELINYSMYGTIVNGVLYSFDVTQDRTPRDDTEPRVSALKDIVAPRMPKPLKVNGDLTRAHPPECRCGARPDLSRGAWEGSALVPHGALLQFGCQAYVFSITDTIQVETQDPAM